MTEVLFWAFFLLILTNYFLFPLLVIALSLVWKRNVKKGPHSPSVSLVISAYNEASIIEKKIRNCLSLEYPGRLLQILVVCDGSTDRSPEIVERLRKENPGKDLRLLFDPARGGKAAAMNRGVQAANGQLIVFSDANTLYRKDAIERLAENFHDPSVGGACGRKCILKEAGRDSSFGDRLFWMFESTLKRSESLLGSIPTADGEMFAIRAALFHPLPPWTINDDTAITLNIVKAGYRVVYEPLAVCEESASLTLKEDMAVKARMVYGGYLNLARYYRLLFPLRSFFALQYFCHKTLRHGMPFLLLGLFLTTLGLQGSFYELMFWGQTVFYVSGLLGALTLKAGKEIKALYLPLYYCLMNFSALQGFLYFLQARPVNAIWTKAER